MIRERKRTPLLITISLVLGASGDLAKKKTYPALFSLYQKGYLPDDTHIIGYARTKMTSEAYLDRITHFIKIKDETTKQQLNKFKTMTTYQSGQYDQDESWKTLDMMIQQSEEQRGIPPGKRNRVFYMALPPSLFVPVAKGLKKNVYAKEGLTRLVVEKPFGMDTDSSNQLARELNSLYSEKEVLYFVAISAEKKPLMCIFIIIDLPH